MSDTKSIITSCEYTDLRTEKCWIFVETHHIGTVQQAIVSSNIVRSMHRIYNRRSQHNTPDLTAITGSSVSICVTGFSR